MVRQSIAQNKSDRTCRNHVRSDGAFTNMEPHYKPRPRFVGNLIVQPHAAVCLRLLVKREQHHEESVRPECLLPAQEAVASERAMTPTMPPDRPEEAVMRYVRELAKRLAREDHEAEIAARQASDPAISKRP